MAKAELVLMMKREQPSSWLGYYEDIIGTAVTKIVPPLGEYSPSRVDCTITTPRDSNSEVEFCLADAKPISNLVNQR